MALARNTNLQMDSNLSDLRRLERELLHDMPPARQETWLHETTEAQAAVSARVSRRLEGRRLRARARRAELNECSNKYFYRCMMAKSPVAYVSELLAANSEPDSAPEVIDEQLCEFYTELFAQGGKSDGAQDALLAEWSARFNWKQQNSLDAPFTAAEIDHSPYCKSLGPDSLTDRTPSDVASHCCWSAGIVTYSWRKTTVCLILKKGDLHDPGNQRSIPMPKAKIETTVPDIRSSGARAPKTMNSSLGH